MSAAAAQVVDAPAKAAPSKKKKLIIIAAVVVLLLAALGAGGIVFLKKRAAAAEEAGDDAPAATEHASEHVAPPTFVPLDPFVVNLADHDQERYAQIGITLEVTDAKAAEELKAYMPAIRNGILLTLAQKTSADLLDRAGKEKLAAEVLRESVRPLGYKIDAPTEGASATDAPRKRKSKAKDESGGPPVKAVHFSSFIIQ